jgi:cytochrome c5
VRLNKKIVIPGILACIVVISAAATSSAKKEPLYTNLKVLPKDISSKELQAIMADDFEDGLGVTCGFCHANAKDGHGLDFASDEKPEKEIARGMMRMTLGINKKYFKAKHPQIGSNALTITCTTCHKGEAFPDGDITRK